MQKLAKIIATSALGLIGVSAISGCGALIAGYSASKGNVAGVIFGEGINRMEAAQAGQSQQTTIINNQRSYPWTEYYTNAGGTFQLIHDSPNVTTTYRVGD